MSAVQEMNDDQDVKDLDRDAAMATLTDEEIEALNDDDDELTGNPDLAPQDQLEPEQEAKPEIEAAAHPVAETAESAGDSADKATTKALPAAYHAELPADFDAKMQAVDAAEKELAEKFEEGDIDPAEYVRETKRIMSERSRLDKMQLKAELSAEMAQQAALRDWERQVNTFLAEKKAEGVDYLGNTALGVELDATIKALAANPSYMDKPGEWFLKTAHHAVIAANGLQANRANPVAPASRKPATDKLPATLAHIPGTDGGSDEFADIDKLDGLEYEAALRKMSPAQREKYLAAV